MNIEKRKHLIKKLLYQSCNRGCKETDLLIGHFAKENLDKMSDEELFIFSDILSIPDVDIYDWYTNKKPLPQEKLSSVMTQILNFNPN